MIFFSLFLANLCFIFIVYYSRDYSRDYNTLTEKQLASIHQCTHSAFDLIDNMQTDSDLLYFSHCSLHQLTGLLAQYQQNQSRRFVNNLIYVRNT